MPRNFASPLWRPAALSLALALPGLAAGHAAAAEHSPAACVAIQSDAERLACYDRALGRDAPAPAPQAGGDPTLAASDLYPAEAGAERLKRRSLLDGRWELSPQAKLGTFNMRAHRPVYVLPLFWSSRTNRQPDSPNPLNTVGAPLAIDALENKFQVSFKNKLLQGIFDGHGDLWFGFTQTSRWQLYNDDDSRPFRETNYEPEMLLVFGTDIGLPGDWRLRMLGAGFAHQSNGRALPFSRSWDRMLVDVGIERDDWVVQIRPWWRIPESDHDDDNPDISDYMGRGELRVVHQRGAQEFALGLRHSLHGGDRSHGSLQFDWSFPLHRYLRGHLQLFDGYGESMIDYNHRATYFGVGVSLLRWY